MESYDLGAKGEEIAKKYLISIGQCAHLYRGQNSDLWVLRTTWRIRYC